VPGAAVELTVMLSFAVPAPPNGGVTEVGVNDAVTPGGGVEMLRDTAAWKLYKEVTETVEIPKLPKLIFSTLGLAETAKSGGSVTVRLITFSRVRPPPTADTRNVYGPPIGV